MTTAAASICIAGDTARGSSRAACVDECRVRLGPCEIRVRGDHPQALADFAHLYADRLINQPHGDAAIDLIITCAPSSRPWRARYRIASGGETIFDDLRRGEVLPYLEWAVNYRFIMDCRRFVLVHAATVVWRGRGVALVGASGSGKSTLAAALVTRGAEYLCDEFALIDPETLRLHPFPRALCVKSGSFPLMRQLGLPLWRRRSHVKAFKGRVGYVRSCHLHPGAESAPLDTVIFPSFTGGDGPRAYPTPRSQTALALAGGVLNGHHHVRSAGEMAARAAARVAGHALSVGPIEATADLVAALLDRGSSRWAGDTGAKAASQGCEPAEAR